MKYISALVLTLSIVTPARPAPPGNAPARTDENTLVSRARQTAGAMLARLPNYTCLETLERSERWPGERKFRLLDRVRVEVAFVGGAELYAWPGSARFEESGLHSFLVGPGATSTGDFGGILRFTYLSGWPLHLAGKSGIKGRDAWKFTQSVPARVSPFAAEAPKVRLAVGYELTAWHDAANLDLLRLEMLISKFPKVFPMRRIRKSTEYMTVPVNGAPMRLPAVTELSITMLNGLENWTVSTFSNCREYKGESTLTFAEDATGESDSSLKSSAAPELPGGAEVHVELDHAVDLKQAARGDAVTMTVSRDVIGASGKVLAAGTRIRGRWTLIECGDKPAPYCFGALETESYDDGRRSGRFRGKLESPSLESELAGGTHAFEQGRRVTTPSEVPSAWKGMPIVYAKRAATLPRGYPLIWRTLEVSRGTKP